MITRKSLIWATTALAGSLAFAGTASAQSTGTEATEVQEVVVTGTRGPRTTDGTIVAETAGKTRSTVTQEFISTQAAGQTIVQTLNLTPGLNFTNNDPYGSSGGNIRLRGFDGNRVSLTFDGIPLNDTGNYASYTNQQLDPELIERASVNTGTTDVDSPTASATGGTINYTSRRPAADFGGWIQGSLGDFDYKRIMALVDTGQVGPWGTSAWFAVSHQEYDKFKGQGDLKKTQYNMRIYQPLGSNGDFVALSAHYNENRNFSYYSPSLESTSALGVVTPAEVETSPFGWNIDYSTNYVAPTFRNGVADIDLNTSSTVAAAYYGLRINPSDTGNVRLNSKFTLAEGLTFTFDPSFQYTQANGGGQQTTLTETNALIRGTRTTGGIDLNGDGDTLDTVRVMTPSNTNTYRYGINSSLIWNINDDHQLRAAYTLDYGRHRQTGAYGFIDFSDPANPRFADEFGGLDDKNNRIVNLDGYYLRARDRLSYAELNQAAFEYRGDFLDKALRINIGVRMPFFKRELNQYCYSQNSSSSVRCTSETPNATLANGNVTFASTGTTQYIAPYSRELKYDDVLPNVGATYRFGGDHMVYASYAEGISAPRTDSLYSVTRLADGSIGNPNVQPETTKTFDLGYRYQTSSLIASAAVWHTDYQNRIVSSYDQDLGFNVDRNVGAVESYGFDGSLGWEPTDKLSIFASLSLLESELKDNVNISSTLVALTKGKEVVETPKETLGLRIAYDFNPVFSAAIQGKYVGERWVTDVNDQKVDAYTVVDLDARFDFAPLGLQGTYLQFNVINLFDERYYGSLGSTTSSVVGGAGYSRPFANIAAPRTVMASVRYAF
ncbi:MULTISPECIES: TonB-dependent receptor [Brevundimonas]|uniref:TonB-dependent receptor n=1 Tax=Brevundimonas nasdae TaxID=172043 RepID=A0ACD4VMW9_9CAUL|nr:MULTISPECIES: TonB-dependent receptor [Brevundimonas]WOB79298.1 TonB-dependent receptor [Brevundimonas nasdae]